MLYYLIPISRPKRDEEFRCYEEVRPFSSLSRVLYGDPRPFWDEVFRPSDPYVCFSRVISRDSVFFSEILKSSSLLGREKIDLFSRFLIAPHQATLHVSQPLAQHSISLALEQLATNIHLEGIMLQAHRCPGCD